MGQSEKNEYNSTIRDWEFWNKKAINRLQYISLALSFLVLFFAGWAGKIKNNLRFFVFLVLLTWVVNAFVTGALANVFDRLQARVTWLLILPALLIVWKMGEKVYSKLDKKTRE